MTPPSPQVHRNQAGGYTLTWVIVGACSFSVHYATLAEVEAAALAIVEEVRFQERMEDGERVVD